MNCTRCNDIDLSLINYYLMETGEYEATFECRACGMIFNATITETQLANYR